MKQNATGVQMAGVIARVEQSGYQAHISQDEERTVIGVIGNDRLLDREQIERMDGVEQTVPILRPFKLAGREFQPQQSVVSI
ncbi:3-deoxy-7-phosphoheptulonate synthase, partial [Candidatus Bipolaricaulota bacterium]|nr:3-deoxy-7-phosphoheptulonate synthase [Candidatus Bipolaricaulota bacterium]